MVLENFLGWAPDNEAQHSLALAALAPTAICSAPDPANIPDNLDLPDWQQQLQGYWPFCHAFMRTGAEEVLYWLAKRDWLEFSHYRAAILNMRTDGNDSSPVGASISGAFRSAIADGAALEKFQLYPPLYPPNNVQSSAQIDAWCSSIYKNIVQPLATQDATNRHIKSVTPNIRSYDQLKQLMVTGRYVFGLGMDWTTGMDNIKGVDQYPSLPSGSVRGGHALFVFGWKKVNGDLWPIMHNSQSNLWGVRRRCAFPPRWWDYVLSRGRYGAFGASDIAITDTNPQPRDLTFAASYITI